MVVLLHPACVVEELRILHLLARIARRVARLPEPILEDLRADTAGELRRVALVKAFHVVEHRTTYTLARVGLRADWSGERGERDQRDRECARGALQAMTHSALMPGRC